MSVTTQSFSNFSGSAPAARETSLLPKTVDDESTARSSFSENGELTNDEQVELELHLASFFERIGRTQNRRPSLVSQIRSYSSSANKPTSPTPLLRAPAYRYFERSRLAALRDCANQANRSAIHLHLWRSRLNSFMRSIYIAVVVLLSIGIWLALR
jgi:hypothetical protein